MFVALQHMSAASHLSWRRKAKDRLLYGRRPPATAASAAGRSRPGILLIADRGFRPEEGSRKAADALRLADLPELSYDLSMKSLTIRLPNELAERLQRESRERGVSKSDLVRERLIHDVPPQPTEPGLTDILEAAWRAKTPARISRFRSSHKRRIAEVIRARKQPR